MLEEQTQSRWRACSSAVENVPPGLGLFLCRLQSKTLQTANVELVFFLALSLRYYNYEILHFLEW